VETATNITQMNWNVIGNQIHGDSGARSVTNAISAAASQRYYRVVVITMP
jgi:hypothetical protein